MKIFDAIVFLAIIAVMVMALGRGVEIPMSVRYIFLCVGSIAAIDFFDR